MMYLLFAAIATAQEETTEESMLDVYKFQYADKKCATDEHALIESKAMHIDELKAGGLEACMKRCHATKDAEDVEARCIGVTYFPVREDQKAYTWCNLYRACPAFHAAGNKSNSGKTYLRVSHHENFIQQILILAQDNTLTSCAICSTLAALIGIYLNKKAENQGFEVVYGGAPGRSRGATNPVTTKLQNTWNKAAGRTLI